MTMLGPMVVVADAAAPSLVDALREAGAFPVVECSFADAAATITDVQPAALMLASPLPVEDQHARHALIQKIETRGDPYMPVFVCMRDEEAIANAMPVPPGEPLNRLMTRLQSAIRIRTTHVNVMRRLQAAQKDKIRGLPKTLLEQATVLCIGRGPSYPILTTAIGERTNLIGTFSVETAARYLNARDIDGIVIGDGFGPRIVEALLTVLGEDERFRNLPVGVLGAAPLAAERLPNLVHVESNPRWLVESLIPLVRLQAFESHLKRTLKSLDTDGMVDPDTGLLAGNAFWRDLDQAVRRAEDARSALSVARFAFEAIDPRASIDAARLFSRLVRNVDFACRDEDGSILAAFTETDLRSAHVMARRLANILRQTMLSPQGDRGSIRPTITLATLKANDDLGTLVARIGTSPNVAVG